MSTLSSGAVAVLLSFFPALLEAQVWVPRTSRPYPGGVAFAEHGFAGRPVLATARHLWEWDGFLWKRGPGVSASNFSVLDLDFDRQRRQVVLLVATGVSGTVTETWTFDGRQWRSHGPPPVSGMRSLHYVPALGAVVAFWQDARTMTTQDWRWNGTSWVALPPGQRPFDLVGDMAADTGRGQLVLVGWLGTPYAGQTWLWDGVRWQQQTGTPQAPQRLHVAMGYDPLRGRVIRFGGHGVATLHNDTWEWNGTAWSQALPPVAPPVGTDFGLAFDRTRGRMVLFDLGLFAGGDWEWDGISWAALPAQQPPASAFAISANDIARGRLVRYLGDPAGSTYEWDGNRWFRLAGSAPSPRITSMAWDAASGDCVLFGGADGLLTRYFQDTWLWNGSVWTQATPPVSPPARTAHALEYHGPSGGVILFGGLDANQAPLQDTWLWSGGTWTDLTALLPVAPPGGPSVFEKGVLSGDPHLVSGGQLWRWTRGWQLVSPTVPVTGILGRDPDSGRPVLVGVGTTGSIQSWQHNGTRWVPGQGPEDHVNDAAYDPLRGNLMAFAQGEPWVYTRTPGGDAPFGSGCGTPEPIQLAQGRSQHGTPFFRLAAQVESSAPAFFLLGLGQGATPLGNGCNSLLVAPVPVGFSIANASGFASFPLPIPNLPVLRGFTLYAQAVTLQPQGPLLGLALTAGLVMTIGD